MTLEIIAWLLRISNIKYYAILRKIVKILAIKLIEICVEISTGIEISSHSLFRITYPDSILIKHTADNARLGNISPACRFNLDSWDVIKTKTSAWTLPVWNCIDISKGQFFRIKESRLQKYIAFQILRYRDLLKSPSKLFNTDGVLRFSNADNINTVMVSEVFQRINVFLESGLFNPEKLSLTNIYTIPYWQGSGTGFAFDDISMIKVKTASGTDITQSGIIGVMFDKNSVGVCNSEKRVTTNYNPRAEFYTNFYKYDCQYFNDLSQNCVVFYVADSQ